MSDPSNLFYPQKTDEGKSTGDGEKQVVTEEEVEQPVEKPASAVESSSVSAEEKTSEKNADEAKVNKTEVETEGNEDGDDSSEKEDESTESISKYFQKNPSEGRDLKGGDFKLKEGDYEEKDGKLIIRADHLRDDIEKIFTAKGKDAYNHIKRIRKANPEKASLIAKYMGFTLPDGEVDVDGFVSATRRFFSEDTPEEEAEKIRTEIFPDWVSDPDKDRPFVYREPKKEPSVSPNIPYSLSEIEDQVDRLVEIYNGKQSGEGNHITIEQVLNDPKVFEYIKSNKFDRTTGKPMSAKDIVSEAFSHRYKAEKEEIRTEGGKRSVAPSAAPVKKKSTGFTSSYRQSGKSVADQLYPTN